MVDDDNNAWNKFKNVFGSVEYDLLCKQHITRDGEESCQSLLLKRKLRMNYREHF